MCSICKGCKGHGPTGFEWEVDTLKGARESNPDGLQDVSLGLSHGVNQILERWFL